MRAASKLNLLKAALKGIPKGLPNDIIDDVEIDWYNRSDGLPGPSYWVYLKDGYKTEGGYGCHTIHEDNLKNITSAMREIVETEPDYAIAF